MLRSFLTNFARKCITPNPIAQQARFAGHHGGTKRIVWKKGPRVIQIGLGRRVEFFYPSGYKHQRVSLWQNTRPNVIYDSNMRRWMATWFVNGQQVFKTFSHRRQPFERARQKAIIMVRQMRAMGILNLSRQRPKPDRTRSGLVGVFFDPLERKWVSRYNTAGHKKFNVFDPATMGFDKAFLAAVAVRKQKLAENFRFHPQRFRIRRRAPYFK
eukprot:GDKJ01016834.1.p1 GENE.GDKJ01016834.1~~GDKJ01016834.1.p1  ORF type:complete len:213 (-),score=33.36 GDKJ01016834.1:56-694(-)